MTKTTRKTRRRGRRGATPSSTLHGITSTQATPLNMIFALEWLTTIPGAGAGVVTTQTIYVDQNGDLVGGPPSEGLWNIMKIGTYEHFIDLVQRKGLYKEFKINSVTWKFFKDSAAHLGSSTQAACRYIGNAFDHRHSKMFRNPLMNALPPDPLLSQSEEADFRYARYLAQSPGKMLDTINGRTASMSCPARCITRRVLYSEGANSVAVADEIPITTTTKFPWMSLERDLSKLPQCGEVNTFIPMVVIRLDSNTNLPNTDTIEADPQTWKPFLREQIQKFGWFYRANVSWSVRGKHLEAQLAVTPAAEVITID